MKILDAAIHYSKLLNWAVFPVHSVSNGKCTCSKGIYCSSPGKHPRTKNGFLDATTDLGQIKTWFTQDPMSNIGIATGKKSGFFVVDVDTENHGFSSLRDITDFYGDFPETVEAISGSGGKHLLFKYRDGIGSRTNLFNGIDIRGDGGYIIVAPSFHISGRNYEWELSSKPYLTEIAEAPKWLLKYLLRSKSELTNKKSPGHWVNIFNGVYEGERNVSAASLVGYLLSKNLDTYLVVEIMKLWNATRVHPPLSSSELDRVINSIASRELRK